MLTYLHMELLSEVLLTNQIQDLNCAVVTDGVYDKNEKGWMDSICVTNLSLMNLTPDGGSDEVIDGAITYIICLWNNQCLVGSMLDEFIGTGD